MVAAAALVLIGALGLSATAAAAGPNLAAPATIDGPGAGITTLGGMAIARDGTGGVTYLKQVGGVEHVFVSRLVGGVFQPPEQIDGVLGPASSQPVVAAAANGDLVIAFINNGSLYEVWRPSSAAGYVGPRDLWDGAANPSLGMTIFGKAYVAFTANGSGGHDVRAAYMSSIGTWSAPPDPLDASASDDAGANSGRPSVAAANDGVGIVAWGEAGHVFARRVVASRASTNVEQVDPPAVGGAPELSADQPAASTGGDSSYADIAFHEVLSTASGPQSRVLMGRLHAGLIDAPVGIDLLRTPGAGGADQPQVALDEYGHGFLTVHRTDVQQVTAAHADTSGVIDSVFRADSLTNAWNTYAVPGTAGLFSTLLAWQHDPGPLGLPEIRARYAIDGETLGPELIVSTPLAGAADAVDGIAAGGDGRGDAVVAWMQGPSAARRISVAQFYWPPGGITPITQFAYLRSARPRVSWNAAAAFWGPIRYVVSIDGAPVAQTSGTSYTPPAPLADGSHTWQVSAIDPVNGSSTMRRASFWTDTVAPVVTLSLTRTFQVGTHIHGHAVYTDAPPPEPPAASSGITSVRINWGDGTTQPLLHDQYHAYRRAGRYRVTVRVTDRTGNVGIASRVITIKAKPKPKPKPKPKKKARRATSHHGTRDPGR